MTSSSNPKTTKTPKPKPAKRSPRRERLNLSATQKAQAVLAVWTEKARPAEVCRQLNINWMTFSHWQRRAMEGMLQALEPHLSLSEGLSPRLQQLLQKQQRHAALNQLTQRLEKLGQPKLASAPPPEAKLE